MQEIVVEPLGDAWAVRVSGTEPQVHPSGATAEQAAKNIAARLASAGEQVELHVMLRDGQRGARFLCLPPLSDDDEPLLVGGPSVNHLRADIDLVAA